MPTPLRRALSLATGWLMDRGLPQGLRAPVYRAYARCTGADLSEARGPLEIYPSLGAFFVRRLIDGARAFPADPGVLPSPCDGRLQDLSRIERGSILQAKGRPYELRELLAGADAGIEMEGGWAWTIYLSPRDYHRVHCPLESRLVELAWAGKARRSVAPGVLSSRSRVLAMNERAVLRLESGSITYCLVMVGALNVGRIRVQGIEPGKCGRLERPARFARGEELARFEMGSTVVLAFPRGSFVPCEGLANGDLVRMGQPIGKRGVASSGSSP